jgi:hypothetical protein
MVGNMCYGSAPGGFLPRMNPQLHSAGRTRTLTIEYKDDRVIGAGQPGGTLTMVSSGSHLP